jgi:hypothetical protein
VQNTYVSFGVKFLWPRALRRGRVGTHMQLASGPHEAWRYFEELDKAR